MNYFFFSVIMVICMSIILYLHLRNLTIKFIFIRKIKIMNVFIASGHDFDNSDIVIEHIPLQTIIDEAGRQAKKLIIADNLSNELYSGTVRDYKQLEYRNNVIIVLIILIAGVCITLVDV